MVLRRPGNKTKIAHKIQAYFPFHNYYIEPFFGAGGMFFHKKKAQYNSVNDKDSDVYNLFNVLIKDKKSLYDLMECVPMHEDLLRFWIKNKEEEPLLRAARFLFLSNWTLFGKGSTLKKGEENQKTILLKNIEKTYRFIQNVDFSNRDFLAFINSLPMKRPESTLIYCDPPYLYTDDNYESSFKEEDLSNLFDCVQSKNCKFAISEFDNEFILNEAKTRGLFVNVIGERRNINNRRTEILVTNYETKKSLFD